MDAHPDPPLEHHGLHAVSRAEHDLPIHPNDGLVRSLADELPGLALGGGHLLTHRS